MSSGIHISHHQANDLFFYEARDAVTVTCTAGVLFHLLLSNERETPAPPKKLDDNKVDCEIYTGSYCCNLATCQLPYDTRFARRCSGRPVLPTGLHCYRFHALTQYLAYSVR